jgi:acetoin utilization deacetylase AcuC-like enzyme
VDVLSGTAHVDTVVSSGTSAALSASLGMLRRALGETGHTGGRDGVSALLLPALAARTASTAPSVSGASFGARRVFCVLRPPGHHCGCSLRLGAGKLGFCLLANAALAARYAAACFARALLADQQNRTPPAAAAPPAGPPERAQRGRAQKAQRGLLRGLRVAILDIDTHAGNGTEDVVCAIAQQMGLLEHTASYSRPWVFGRLYAGNTMGPLSSPAPADPASSAASVCSCVPSTPSGTSPASGDTGGHDSCTESDECARSPHASAASCDSLFFFRNPAWATTHAPHAAATASASASSSSSPSSSSSSSVAFASASVAAQVAGTAFARLSERHAAYASAVTGSVHGKGTPAWIGGVQSPATSARPNASPSSQSDDGGTEDEDQEGGEWNALEHFASCYQGCYPRQLPDGSHWIAPATPTAPLYYCVYRRPSDVRSRCIEASLPRGGQGGGADTPWSHTEARRPRGHCDPDTGNASLDEAVRRIDAYTVPIAVPLPGIDLRTFPAAAAAAVAAASTNGEAPLPRLQPKAPELSQQMLYISVHQLDENAFPNYFKSHDYLTVGDAYARVYTEPGVAPFAASGQATGPRGMNNGSRTESNLQAGEARLAQNASTSTVQGTCRHKQQKHENQYGIQHQQRMNEASNDDTSETNKDTTMSLFPPRWFDPGLLPDSDATFLASVSLPLPVNTTRARPNPQAQTQVSKEKASPVAMTPPDGDTDDRSSTITSSEDDESEADSDDGEQRRSHRGRGKARGKARGRGRGRGRGRSGQHAKQQLPVFDPAYLAHLEAKSGNPGSHEWRRMMMQTVFPILRRFQPELIVLSAGFDGHRDDPVGSLNLLTEDYSWIGEQLGTLRLPHAKAPNPGPSSEADPVPILALMEGGYGTGQAPPRTDDGRIIRSAQEMRQYLSMRPSPPAMERAAVRGRGGRGRGRRRGGCINGVWSAMDMTTAPAAPLPASAEALIRGLATVDSHRRAITNATEGRMVQSHAPRNEAVLTDPPAFPSTHKILCCLASSLGTASVAAGVQTPGSSQGRKRRHSNIQHNNSKSATNAPPLKSERGAVAGMAATDVAVGTHKRPRLGG